MVGAGVEKSVWRQPMSNILFILLFIISLLSLYTFTVEKIEDRNINYIFYMPTATQRFFLVSILSGFILSIFMCVFIWHIHMVYMHLFFYLQIYACICLYMHIFVYVHLEIQMMFVELSKKVLKTVQKNLSHPQAQNHHPCFVTPKFTPSAHTKNDGTEII